MYRKLLALSVILILLLVGCGDKNGEKPENTSDKMYELGCAALETVDEYLDGDIKIGEANSRIKDTYRWVKVQFDNDLEELETKALVGTKYENDSSIYHNVVMLNNAIFDKDQGTGTKSNITEQRNDLAKTMNKKSR